MENLTKNEKRFIIAFYLSLADTLGFSTLKDVQEHLDLPMESLKGLLGSLTKKGLINPLGENNEDGKETLDSTYELYELMKKQELPKEFGYVYDGNDTDYEYLSKIEAITHQLLVRNFDTEATPSRWTELVKEGSYKDCEKALVKRADEINVTTGYLLSGGGYEIVDLDKARIDKIKNVAPELLEALEELVECSPCQNGCDKDDMTCATRKAEAVIKKAKGE